MGGQPERLELAGDHAAFPAVSSRVASSRTRVLGLDADIWKFESNGPPENFLSSTLDDRNAQFSPDGKKIVFESRRLGKDTQLWVANSDGTNPAPLTEGAAGSRGQSSLVARQPLDCLRRARTGRTAGRLCRRCGRRTAPPSHRSRGRAKLVARRQVDLLRLQSRGSGRSLAHTRSGRRRRSDHRQRRRAMPSSRRTERLSTTGSYRCARRAVCQTRGRRAGTSSAGLDAGQASPPVLPGGGRHLLRGSSGSKLPFAFELRFLNLATGKHETLNRFEARSVWASPCHRTEKPFCTRAPSPRPATISC